jgi:alkylation response protein AidB-like acyl-CoA dehydrogenase
MTTQDQGIDYSAIDSAVGQNWYRTDPNLSTVMDKYIPADDRAFSEETLVQWGDLCGGPIARRADSIDRNPPRLDRYDEWGDDVSTIVHHPDAIATKQDIWDQGPQGMANQGRKVPTVLGSAFTYLLSQSDTGMVCSTGMTSGVEALVDRFAPPDVREKVLPHLQSPTYDGSWDGAMFMTELRGGSDLASSETVATQVGDGWVLNGDKWFCSNVDAGAIATLARAEGADPGLRGLSLFLVPATKADGSRNGIRIKRLKDKLGTRSVPTGEIDFVDAEAYPMSNPKSDKGGSEARGINRMMSMVNGSRLGVATMGLGIMRRSFFESAIYAAHRTAFGKRLDELPLMQETLVRMVAAIEGVSSLIFETASLVSATGDESGRRLYRILVPLSKLKGARGGLELASQAVEVHGGNGYIENWPTARQLRDAQCHTIWEGTENIICLDVLRSMAKDNAHDALLDRIDGTLEAAVHPSLTAVRDAIAQARRDAQEIIAFLATADNDIRQLHARRAGSLLSDLTQAALLLEAAQEELDSSGSARKAAVARFFVRDRLVAGHPLRGIDEDRSTLDLFGPITRYAPVEPSAMPSSV